MGLRVEATKRLNAPTAKPDEPGNWIGPVMRIAQVAPLAESVPPKLYGGTERVISWLTEELVEAGHDVTLFASGDSATQAKLIPVGLAHFG
jgi:hypothetical protein